MTMNGLSVKRSLSEAVCSANAEHFMANVNWSAGIDSVSGALSKPGKGQHSCQKMLLGTHRTAPTTSTNCNRLYLRKKVQRSTVPSADELSHRATFGAIARAVNTRLHNQQQHAQDVAAFKAQSRYTTLRQYVWNLCTNEYYSNQG